MKKSLIFTLFFALLFLLLVVPRPCPAADRACEPIWNDVAGQTYVLDIGEQSYDIQFSESYAGPCPQGMVEIYDGVYIAPCLTCRYVSYGDNLIAIICGDAELPLMLIENMLVVVDPNAPFMTRKD